MTTQNVFIGFAGLIVILGAWSVYAGKGMPWHQSQGQQRGRKHQRQSSQQDEPEGDPADWTREELKAWLENVSLGT